MAQERRGEDGSIYRYRTKEGVRWRFVFRDSRGRQSSRRGFTSRREAQRERERLMGKVHRGEVRTSREDLGGYWERYLHARRPYLENGSWRDYRCHGERRILPHLGDRKLTSLTAPELRDWLVELAETGDCARCGRSGYALMSTQRSARGTRRRNTPDRRAPVHLDAIRGALGAARHAQRSGGICARTTAIRSVCVRASQQPLDMRSCSGLRVPRLASCRRGRRTTVANGASDPAFGNTVRERLAGQEHGVEV